MVRPHPTRVGSSAHPRAASRAGGDQPRGASSSVAIARRQRACSARRHAASRCGRNTRSTRRARSSSRCEAQSPTPSPASSPAPSAVVSMTRGRLHRDAEQVGLHLHEQVVRGGAAVDAQGAQPRAGVARHGLDQVGALERDRVERGAHQVRARGAAGEAQQGAAHVGAPVGRAQPDERRHQRDAAAVRHGARQRLALGRGGDGAEPVAQPLDRGAGDEHAALERVGGAAVGIARHRGEQSGTRAHTASGPGVEQQEAAGAVRVLGAPAVTQPWPKSAACWSPATPAIGMPSGSPLTPRVTPKSPLEGRTSGSSARGTPKRSSSAVVPAQRARGRTASCARRWWGRSRARRRR